MPLSGACHLTIRVSLTAIPLIFIKADFYCSVTSSEIESSLSLSSENERQLFSSRNAFDRIIIYDRSSTAISYSPPITTSSDAQRTLYNLVNAIYNREFHKSLKRQPVLLVGGWEAWEAENRKRNAAATAGNGALLSRDEDERWRDENAEVREDRRREEVDEFGRMETKKANRRVTVIGSDYLDTNGIKVGLATKLFTRTFELI